MLLYQIYARFSIHCGPFFQIATYLMERYPGHCFPWHIDVEAYTLAIQADGIAASNRDLEMLNMLPEVFAPLVETIQVQGK